MDNRPKSYNRVSITTSKYHPQSKPSACRPQAPSDAFGASSLPEGAISLSHFTLDFAFEKMPAVNPSVTPPACQLPQAGSLWLFPFTHPYHLVVEVQAVNLQLAGSSRRCTAAVDFVPGTTYKEALILAVMSRMLFCMVSLPPLRATSTLRMA